jgi:hypothetical protein
MFLALAAVLLIFGGCAQIPVPRPSTPKTALLDLADLPPLPTPSRALEAPEAAAAVVRPPAARWLAWDNCDAIATNLAAYLPWWNTQVESTADFRTWLIATNVPLSVTNYGPIPAGRFWRVGYAPR